MQSLLTSFITTTILTFLFISLPADAEAQHRDQQVWRDNPPAQPMNNPGPPQLPGAPTQTPIGSGLGLLLAAGGAYALNRLRRQQDQTG
ncbi:MAG: hypothetical protein LAT75_09085 [Candidatus Cyclonatronum sp.]|uniref:PID-CTERM protein-sorting domain-containing protein n=1 Tax=Cyclonatronum sp. TaxID=3024185 RepID=UPI0025C515E6|nr:hypothetical protein [Cyclonatronum sp.]MCH8487009.1 hypothetical protein [Cyclonatronum sp.]